MQIYGPTQIHAPQAIRAPHAPRIAQPASASPAAGGDQLELSQVGQLVNQVRDLPDVRLDRVQQIRTALTGGTYETADKVNTALDRLLDEIA